MSMLNADPIYTILAIVVPLVELFGILAAVHAVMNARTSQGAIAWAISLITFPWLALILYAILGRNKFKGYVLLRSTKDQDIHHYIDKIIDISLSIVDTKLHQCKILGFQDYQAELNLGRALYNFNNGSYYGKIYDLHSNTLIYSRGFDSYYREYITTKKAQQGIKRTYHESFLIPSPKNRVLFSLEKRNQQNCPIFGNINFLLKKND